MNKVVLAWVIAIVVTITAVIYQRATGPTYPKKENITYNNQTYKLKLLRSSGGEEDAPVELKMNVENLNANIFYKKFKINEVYAAASFTKEGEKWVGRLPNQPPAGKLEYYIEIKNTDGQTIRLPESGNVVIRYKGLVPTYILAPHVLFMFIAMLLSTLAAVLALLKLEQQRLYGQLSWLFLLLGGMILGPLVQKFAFNEYWAGIPYGFDLTDNKTLIGFVFWTIAVALNYKTPRPWVTIVASLVMLAIYSIPHSMYGSELDHNTGKIIQGGLFILPFIYYGHSLKK